MVKKINKIFLVVIIVLFVLNLVVALFLMTNTAKAEGIGPCDYYDKDKPNPVKPICPKEGKIRVQVPIPGITEGCTYTDANDIKIINNVAQATEKVCYYVDSLPFFVQKFYNFSIGIIAILAVLMIMIGGLRWIFAAGNVGNVSEAKASINAAIMGLLLALCSYVILYNINPRLVNLSLSGLSPVSPIEQENFWCSTWKNNDGTYLSSVSAIKDAQGNEIIGGGRCETKYFITFKNKDGTTTKNKDGTIEGNFCFGNKCDASPDTLCYGFSESSYCINAKYACENSDSRDCYKIDELLIKQSPQYGCAKKTTIRRWPVPSTSVCEYVSVLTCPSGKNRVNCEDDITKSVCVDSRLERKPGCVNINEAPRAVAGVDKVCCFDGNNYTLVGEGGNASGGEGDGAGDGSGLGDAN